MHNVCTCQVFKRRPPESAARIFNKEAVNDLQRRSSLVEISINLVPSGVGGKHRNATNRSIFAIWPCPGGALELTRTEPPTSIHPPSRYTNESVDFCHVYRVVWSFSILFIETRKIKPFDL